MTAIDVHLQTARTETRNTCRPHSSMRVVTQIREQPNGGFRPMANGTQSIVIMIQSAPGLTVSLYTALNDLDCAPALHLSGASTAPLGGSLTLQCAAGRPDQARIAAGYPSFCFSAAETRFCAMGACFSGQVTSKTAQPVTVFASSVSAMDPTWVSRRR